jgi:hypothetical protein
MDARVSPVAVGVDLLGSVEIADDDAHFLLLLLLLWRWYCVKTLAQCGSCSVSVREHEVFGLKLGGSMAPWLIPDTVKCTGIDVDLCNGLLCLVE